MSFQYAFVKQKSTGKVDTNKIYTGGRHWIGPDYTFKTFRADAHFEDLPKITAFTTDKLEVTISCAFQYFLRPEDLADMHKEYDLFYRPVVRSTALAAVKSKAALISMTDYLKNREKVELQIFESLALRLGGQCCRKDCVSRANCKLDCKPYASCTREDKGLFVDIRYFQLHEVEIASDIKTRYLRQIIETAEDEKAQYTQSKKVFTFLQRYYRPCIAFFIFQMKTIVIYELRV